MTKNILADLLVRIGADTGPLKSGVADSKGELEKFAADAKQIGKKIGEGLAVAGTVVGAAITLAVKDAYAEIDDLAKKADTLGTSTQNLAALRLAAEHAGVGEEQVTKGVVKMQTAVGQANQGLATYTRIFNELGINTKQLAQLDPADQLTRINAALAGMTNATERTTAAYYIFGGREVQMLKLTKQNVDEARAATERWGTAVNRLDAGKVEAANDAIIGAKEAMKGLADMVAVKTAPVVMQLANDFADADDNANNFGKTVDNVVTYTVKGFGLAGDSIRGLEVIFVAVKTAAAQMIAWTVENLAKMQGAALKVYNEFAKLAHIGKQIDPNTTGLATMAAALQQTADDSGKSLQNLLMTELPSQKVAHFLERAEAAANKTAEHTAKIAKNLQAGTHKQLGHAFDMNEYQTAMYGQAKAIKKEQHEVGKFTRYEWRNTASFVAGQVQNMTSAIAGQSRRAFELNKAASIAQAIINTYTGATKALAQGGFWGIEMAAMVIAAGVAQVDAIKNTTFGGGTTPSAAGATTVNGNPVAAAPQQVMRIEGINPDSLFTGRQIVDIVNQAQKDGAKLVIAQ